MQGIQINPIILEAIFLDQSKLQKNLIKEIITWNQQLQPSVQMTQFIISSFLIPQKNHKDNKQVYQNYQNNLQLQNQSKQINQRMLKAIKDIPKTIKILQEFKCPKNFIRAYLLFIKKNYNTIQKHLNLQYIVQQWKFLPVELFQSYCNTFQIFIQNYSQIKPTTQKKFPLLLIKSDQFDKKIQYLIQKKNYSNCMILIKLSNCQKHHINKLLQKMTNNKDSSKAADYINSLKLNPADYPALGQRLYKNTARHFLTKNGWQYAQEIFQTHPEALACVIQDLVFKKRTKQAISIWYRHQDCRQFISKQETIQFLKQYIEQKGSKIKAQELIDNFLHKDEFGPTDKSKQLYLEQMGIRQQNVIWVNQTSQQLQQYLKQILNSNIIGIDTQSIVGQTKFDKSQHSKYSEAALIQLATIDKIYIFDGLTVKNYPNIKKTIVTYIKENKLIVGHTLDNDMQCLLKSLGCSDEQIKQLKNMKVVDICKLFKSVYPKHRYSSLAFICQTILGKQLCKIQTLTNWQRRPLRKNQLHYAAMDAYVVIQIYKKFLQQLGEQMIEYYCSIDSNQF